VTADEIRTEVASLKKFLDELIGYPNTKIREWVEGRIAELEKELAKKEKR
jgi:outer membrane protein assembly factor BamD (BamD/ComL family)